MCSSCTGAATVLPPITITITITITFTTLYVFLMYWCRNRFTPASVSWSPVRGVMVMVMVMVMVRVMAMVRVMVMADLLAALGQTFSRNNPLGARGPHKE
jgi:uncharacterized membrane protein